MTSGTSGLGSSHGRGLYRGRTFSVKRAQLTFLNWLKSWNLGKRAHGKGVELRAIDVGPGKLKPVRPQQGNICHGSSGWLYWGMVARVLSQWRLMWTQVGDAVVRETLVSQDSSDVLRSDRLSQESSRPGLRSQQISSDSDSGLKISTLTHTPTPLQLQSSKNYSILKKLIMELFFWISILIASKRMIRQYSTHSC